MTLFEKFEEKLEQYNGKLVRAAVELAKDWRTDRILRRLEALLIVANPRRRCSSLSGSGDVIEPDDDVIAIGSGGNYALAAARALLAHTLAGRRAHRRGGHGIAAEICVYTNDKLTRRGARMSQMTPREIVSELDRYIVGQRKAKRAVAIALAQPLAPAAGAPRSCARRSRRRTSS